MLYPSIFSLRLFSRAVCGLLTALVLHAAAESAAAANVSVRWNANTESGILGYKVHYGMSPGNFTTHIDVGTSLSHLFLNLSQDGTYYFAVTAYNANGESDYSAPATVTIVTDPNDLDGDGLSNADEAARGTNPYLSDTDGDGVNDGQEVADGTNPLDPGSGEQTLQQRICTEWNGYLGGMWNIAELVNLSNRKIVANVTLYSQGGQPLSERAYELLPGQQQDSLIHDFVGRNVNAYGNVCITHDGAAGDLDGRMVYYKSSSARSARLGDAFDFAFALPFSNGKKGKQYVLLDTVQRSLAATDRANLVANWIQLSNFGSELAVGTMRFYAGNGVMLGERVLGLAPSERLDVSAHQFGAGQIGFVEWLPENPTVPFQLRNTTYLYDNLGAESSFSSAYQQEGVFASGEDLVVPITSESAQGAMLQVSNTLGTPLTVFVSDYDANGAALLATSRVAINPKATFIYQMEKYLKGKKGFAVIHSGASASVIAGVMQFARNAKKQISYAYLVPAKPAFGTVLRGSYNTYMGQRSIVWIMNRSSTPQNVALSMVRSNGVSPAFPSTFTIPARGMRLVTVPDVDNYGVVTVQTGTPNSLVSWVQRVRPDFVVPTPVRE